ncbi:hypothetical protein GALMADRAFT_147605 [Galerina marginata CBS 339.88]|uniref:Uncharacterized protein n=1 Tax=Galerina marginata (strain CBS 339.88) TaxID=685588 RepID=A0A067S7C1_GALM3|nr:hypothetical protein GALMADRAFT_147605 [Galerina marginata CBS 339.88]
MPIKSGRYFVVNVKSRNRAFLPNPNSDEPLQSMFKQNDTGEQWNVEDLENGYHYIVNVRHKQYAASGDRPSAGALVAGWERAQPWLIQKTRVKGKYTISTTDSKHFWGVPDDEHSTPIALANRYTDPRNWWMFKDVETDGDAEIEPTLNNGRTAYDTATGDKAFQTVFFELVLPHVSRSKPLELDLVIVQEMPNKFIQNAAETMNEICRPLIRSGQLSPSNLSIKIIEIESFQRASRQRFSGIQTFDGLQDYQGYDFPWIRCPGPVIPSSLVQGIKDFRSLATKVVVLNLTSIPIRNGGQALIKLIYQMRNLGVILFLTLSEPHLPDTLFDTDLFRELARLSSGTILTLPEAKNNFYQCIVNYLEDFEIDSIKTRIPDVTTIKPELPLRLRKHLTLDAFIEEGYADDPETPDDDPQPKDD